MDILLLTFKYEYNIISIEELIALVDENKISEMEFHTITGKSYIGLKNWKKEKGQLN